MYTILIQLIIILAFLKDMQGLPIPSLLDKDWDILRKLAQKSQNEEPVIRYYEQMDPFTFKPISFDMDDFTPKTIKGFKPSIRSQEKVKVVSFTQEPGKTSIWQGIKSFFTNDINTISRNIAENYNPIPSILSVIDDVKRSDTWVDINSFVTKGYNRMIKFSKNILGEFDAKIKAELKKESDIYKNKFNV